jgi:glyoxylate reductase
MSKLIYVTRRIPENGIEIMKAKGYSIDVGAKEDAPTKDELIEALKQKPYDGVISFLTDPIDKDIFDACPTAKIFAEYSVGFNNIDVKEATARGIVITNTPGSSSRAVAEQAVALMLTLTTRTMEGDLYMRAGKYNGWSPYLLNGTDLTGKTIGLLGGGAIGFEVASILHFGFNCPIIYNDIKENESFRDKFNAKFVDRETVLRESDIVSLHVPLMESTHHLINKEALHMMKKDAYLINTARGPVVDEVALTEALKDGTIKGAGLDVYEFEPHVTAGLLELDDVVLTPHIASARESVRVKMAEIVGNNIVAFFETGTALNPVKI